MTSPKKTLLRIRTDSNTENSEMDTLNIELLNLENQLKVSDSNPSQIISKILSIKTQITHLKTEKVIQNNRKISAKVQKCLENIEKDWILNEKRSGTPRYRLESTFTSINTSPIASNFPLRSVSPIACKNYGQNSFFSPNISDENIEKSTFFKNSKEKEDNFDIISSVKEIQEQQLIKIISEYKTKISDLEKERNEILKLRAKVFSEVKKLKILEESLQIREENFNKSQRENSLIWENEGEAVFLIEQRKKIQTANLKINEEYNKIHEEKCQIWKEKALISHKSEALKLIWPRILEMLNSYKKIENI